MTAAQDLPPVREVTETALTERALVGGLLMTGPATQAQVLAVVDADDFEDLQMGWLWVELRHMQRAGLPIDMVTVPNYVREAGRMPNCDMRRRLATSLHSLVTAAPPGANLPWYAQQVVVMAARRRIREAGQRLMAAADGEDLDAVLGVATVQTGSALLALKRAMDHRTFVA